MTRTSELVDVARVASDTTMQARVALSEATAEEYRAAMESGVVFPPIIVYSDGGDDENGPYWLADGFHRLEAARRIGRTKIEADVRAGGRRDALLCCVGANATHGLRRTNEDKRKAVGVLLGDPEWSKWSDSQIARRCSVSNHLVAEVRRSHLGILQDGHTENEVSHLEPPTKRRALRGGVEYEVETGPIGRSKPSTPQRRVDDSYADPVYEDDAEYVPPERPAAATPVPAPPPPPPPPTAPPPPPPAAAGPDPRDARIAALEAEVAQLRADLAATDTKQRKADAVEKDAIGQDIPEDLKPIFGAYGEYRRLIHNHLTLASRLGRKWIEVIGVEAARRGFERASLERDYRELVAHFALGADSWSKAPHAAIEHAAPTVVCIYCHGDACERCNGRGWVTGRLHIDFYRGELERRAKESAS